MTVEVRGISGKAKQVRVGGKRAKLVAGKQVRFIVPKVEAGPQRVEVRTARRRFSARLVIRAPFAGRFTANADSARARSGEVGPAGGTVAATARDGSRFELVVPPGALDRTVEIRLTPLLSVRGLPSPGRRTGVQMEPSGLRFAKAAELAVTFGRATKHPTVAFHGRSDGRAAEVIGAARSGRSVSFEIRHFSSTALNEITDPSGWGGVLQALLTAPSLDVQDAETIADVLAIWEAEDPGSCARHAQLCDDVKRRAVGVVISAFLQTCQAAPRLNDLTEIRRLEHLRERIKPGGWVVTPQSCVNTLLNGLITAAAAPTRQNALQRSLTAHDQLDPAQLASADVSASGPGQPADVSHGEWMRLLRVVSAGEDEPALAAAALEHLQVGLRKVLNDGLALCDTDREAGFIVLRSARGIANGVDATLTQELDAASEACFVAVTISPTELTVAAGENVQFTATVAGGSGGVTWTVSAGTITPAGQYTAPAQVGDHTVTATSVANPARSATATVHVRSGHPWNALDMYISNSGGVTSNLGGDGGEGCEVNVRPPQGTTSWTQKRECSGQTEYGSGSQRTEISVVQTPEGPAVRSVHVDAFTTSSGAWSEPAATSASAGGLGEAGYFITLDLAEVTPYRITGTVRTAVAGGDFEADAYYGIGPHTGCCSTVNRFKTDANDSGNFTDEGVLQPGLWTFAAGVRASAESGVNGGTYVAASQAEGQVGVTLTLDP